MQGRDIGPLFLRDSSAYLRNGGRGVAQIESKLLANRLKSIAAELVGMSKKVDSGGLSSPPDAFVFAPPADCGENCDHGRDLELAACADKLYGERRRRARHFPPNLFAEPAWDILLDLFVNGIRNRGISITSACIAGGIPATTGLRWLGLLEKEGLLVRETSDDDARVTWVRLSDSGMSRMRSYIAESCLALPAECSEVAAVYE